MGYSITIASIKRVQKELELMLANRQPILVIESSNPKHLSYLLNQGMVAAEKLSFPKFEDLRKAYKLTVGDQLVSCKLIGPLSYNSYIVCEGAEKFFDIFDYYLANKGSLSELRFPNAHKHDEDTLSWLTTIDHKWDHNVLIILPKKEVS
jgi:hypothetical protein